MAEKVFVKNLHTASSARG